jgi:AcrR family transcriptional regulator
MARTSRVPATERRARILIAAAPLFEKAGLDGTRTRDIAVAAGVSEALLYQHFPTKEAIYAAIEAQNATIMADPEYLAINALEPSSQKLAIMIATQARRHLTDGVTPGLGTPAERIRVLLSSLADAGQYAREWMQGSIREGGSRVKACLDAADADDERETKVAYPIVFFCIDHIEIMLAAMHVSRNGDLYEHEIETVVREVTRFCLAGAGLRPKVIDRVLEPALRYDFSYWKKSLKHAAKSPRKQKGRSAGG